MGSNALGAVRLQLRQLEKDYDKSEDDIKALQSVGQIIGELVTQLDEERCKLGLSLPGRVHLSQTMLSRAELVCLYSSYREVIFWTSLRCRMSVGCASQQAQGSNPRRTRHDHTHNHAVSTTPLPAAGTKTS